jgi:hypothetical protein
MLDPKWSIDEEGMGMANKGEWEGWVNQNG